MRNNIAKIYGGYAYISCPVCGLTLAQLRDGDKRQITAVIKEHLRQDHTSTDAAKHKHILEDEDQKEVKKYTEAKT